MKGNNNFILLSLWKQSYYLLDLDVYMDRAMFKESENVSWIRPSGLSTSAPNVKCICSGPRLVLHPSFVTILPDFVFITSSDALRPETLFPVSQHCERSFCKTVRFFWSIKTPKMTHLTLIIWAIQSNKMCRVWRAARWRYNIIISRVGRQNGSGSFYREEVETLWLHWAAFIETQRPDQSSLF